MQTRISKVQAELARDAVFLVTNPINVRYLCGYSGSNGILLITRETAVLYTDARYELQAGTECFSVVVEIAGDLFKAAAGSISTNECLIETEHLTVAILERLQILAPNIKFQGSHIRIEKLRQIKDVQEIALISTACEISTAALAQVITQIRTGMNEKQIARMLERAMVDSGADGIAFETIVASGPNSAIAHHQPTNREIQKGDLLKIDFGAKLSGYHSDCTRTFVLGKPTAWQTEIYEAVLGAQSGSRAALKAGVKAQDVVQPTLDALKACGHLENFRHGLSHGVGLEIHEDPYLSSDPTATLEAGTVITIEPGVYLPNQGGVRIEDTIVVTETGYDNLTVFAYELQEIG